MDENTVVDLDETPSGVDVEPSREALEGADLIDKALVEDFNQRFTSSLELMKENFHDDWATAYEQDRLQRSQDDVADHPGTDIHVPQVRKSVWTIIRTMKEALFPSSDWFDYQGQEETDIPAALAMTALTRHNLRKDRVIAELGDRAMFDYVGLGTSVVKTVWHRRVGHRRSHSVQPEPLFDPLSGEIIAIRETPITVDRPVQVASHPHVRAVNLFSFYPSHIDVEDLQELEHVIETSVVTLGALRQDERREIEYSRGGVPIIGEVGIYQNLDMINARAQRHLERHGAGSNVHDPREDASDSKPGGMSVFGFPRKQIWIRLDVQSFLNRKRNGERDFEPEAVRAWIERWRLGRDALEPGGWFLAEWVDDKVLVRLERNPYPMDMTPYDVAAYWPRRGQLFGDGLYRMTEGLSIALDTVVSNTVDSHTKSVKPKHLVDSNAFDENKNSPEEALAFIPDGVGFMKPGRDVRQIVQALLPDPQTIEAGFNGQAQIGDLIETITGATPEVKGEQRSGDSTATEFRGRLEAALGTIALAAQRFEERILTPMLDKVWPLTQENMREAETIRILGPEGAVIHRTVTPDMIQGNMDAFPRGMLEIQDRQLLGQVLVNVTAPFLESGHVDVPELLLLILRTLRAPGNIERVVLTREEVIRRQVEEMQIAQAFASPEEGGAGPTGAGTSVGAIPLLQNRQDMTNATLNA